MDAIPVTEAVSLAPQELRFRFSRSGGPGGQNVNTRDTRVELVFDLAGSPSLDPGQRTRAMERLRSQLDAEGRLRLVVVEERSQAQNRELAIRRLQSLLAEALRPDPPPRRPTRRTRSADEARLASKRARARLKRDRASVPDE
jgi:ribosome-associated protein